MLGVLLEFDFNYGKELHKHEFKRTYIELQKKKIQNLLLSFGGDLFSKKEEVEEEDKQTKKKEDENQEY